MLILHGTAKFLDALHGSPTTPPASSGGGSVFGTWQASLFEVDGTSYFAFLHPQIRLPVFLPFQAPFPLEGFVSHLSSMLDAVGIEKELYAPHLVALIDVTFAKSKDRKQAAALAQLLRDLPAILAQAPGTPDPTSVAVHKRLWEMPFRDMPSHSPLACLRLLLDSKDIPTPPPSKASKPAKKKSKPRAKPASSKKPSPQSAPTLTLIRADGSKTTTNMAPHDRNDTLPELLEIMEEAEIEDIPIDEILREVMTVSPDPGGDLAAILASHPDDEFASDAMMLLFQATSNRSIPESVVRGIAVGAVPELQRAMRDGTVPDTRKLMIGPLLAKFGVPIPDEEYHTYFQDFEAALESMKPKLPPLSPTPACVEKLFAFADIPLAPEYAPLDTEDPAWQLLGTMAHECAETSPETAALLIGLGAATAIWSQAAVDGLFSEMLHGIAQSDQPHVRWQLEALSCWPFAGAIGGAAAEAARGMQIRGVESRHPFLREFSHGYLGMVDGSGARQMALFFRTPEGGMDAVVLLIRSGWGIKDAITLYEEVDNLEETLCDPEMALPLSPCNIPLAREIFADALAVHALSGKRVPPKAYLVRQYLGDERLLPRARTPNLGVYMLETLRRTPELVTDYEPMLEDEPFGGLWFHSDAAYAYVRENKKGLRGGKPQKAWLTSFIAEACIAERETLLRHMAINLEVEALSGHARRSVNKMAARNYLAIEEEVVPFESIPYVRELAERAIQVILGNLKRGYRTQAEANQAALDHDDEMHEMMNEILWSIPDHDLRDPH